ncbi:MAG TPA: hypothetical protein V6D12_06660 [Candidatus Obscuribacterales bacterium]
MANPNPCARTRFKQLEDKPLEEQITVRIKADLMEKVRARGVPSRIAREAIAHHVSCPLNSSDVAAGLDKVAAEFNVSRLELIERIGRGELVVSSAESESAKLRVDIEEQKKAAKKIRELNKKLDAIREKDPAFCSSKKTHDVAVIRTDHLPFSFSAEKPLQ